MRPRDLAIVTTGLLLAEAIGLPGSGLVALTGGLAVAYGGLLFAVSAEQPASRAFAFGLGLIVASALLRAGGGALRTVTATVSAPGLGLLVGLGCAALPVVALLGLQILARGLAAVPDRPPPTRPREWRRAEVLRPDDRARAPARAESGDDDLGLFGGEQ